MMTNDYDKQSKDQLISQLKELQQRAAEYEIQKQYWEQLFTNSPDAIAILDNNESVISINTEFSRLFGFSQAEAAGHNINDLIVPLELQKEGLDLKTRTDRGEIVQVESVRKTKDNKTFDVSIIGKPVVLGGNQLAVIVIYRDITARKEAENALYQGKERYRAVVESTPAMICRFLPDGTLTFVNSFYCEYFKTSETEIVGKNFFQFIPVEDQGKVRNHFLSLTVEKPMITYSHQVISPSGDICWQEWTDQALFDDRKHLIEYQSLGRDITKEELALEEKAGLEKQLRHSQKLEAIGTLAGGIAHDFNNILGIIMGFTELSLDDTGEDSLVHRNLKQIYYAATRAKDLVQQILTFSRQIDDKKVPIRISTVVKNVLKLLRATLPTTIEIRQKIAEDDGIVLTDEIQIQQVMMNLCINAQQAMESEGGILEILLQNVFLDTDYIKGKDLKPGLYVKLSVIDTGQGISSENIKRIFDPYFTTKGPGEGTGLGLSVVHGIVKNHGGDISVYSEPGRGTAVHIFLPVTDTEEAAYTEESHPLAKGNEYLLFIDDESALVEIGTRILENLGYQVEAWTNSTEALNSFRQAPWKYNLVITDQAMPILTGLQLAGEMRRTRPDIPVILCTGFSDTINDENYKNHGINAYVMKPMVKKEIAAVIRKVLDGGT
ncbi:MAG: Histidine kinase [Acidobacteriota bacterium]|nr:Histidine kinase [Acidobacteriota bacterium]